MLIKIMLIKKLECISPKPHFLLLSIDRVQLDLRIQMVNGISAKRLSRRIRSRQVKKGVESMVVYTNFVHFLLMKMWVLSILSADLNYGLDMHSYDKQVL